MLVPSVPLFAHLVDFRPLVGYCRFILVIYMLTLVPTYPILVPIAPY